MSALALPVTTLGEYYYLEAFVHSDIRHEYVDGVVVAMTGGSERHAQLVGRVVRQFNLSLGEAPCEVLVSDLRVRPLKYERVFYPDVVVVCGGIVRDGDRDARLSGVTNPKVIVEVLSPSTARYDQETKLPAYQSIEGLRTILYVHQREKMVEAWTRVSAEEWAWWGHHGGAFDVEGLEGARLDVDRLYEGVLS